MHKHNPSDQQMKLDFSFNVFWPEEKCFYCHWQKDLDEQPAALQQCTCSTQEEWPRDKTFAFQAYVSAVESCFPVSFNKEKRRIICILMSELNVSEGRLRNPIQEKI